MTTRSFVDTNILVYAFGSISATGPDKRRDRAQELLADEPCLSVQVLNEYVDVCRRKAKRKWREIAMSLDVIRELCRPAIPLTIEVHKTAMEISSRYELRIYDSLIIAAAVEAGCTMLYTEDLHHGQVVEGLRIENPFREIS